MRRRREAVAEAQSYARDLEETAREQYRVILQRANEAARSTAGAAPAPSAGSEGNGVNGPDAKAGAAAPSAAEAQQLDCSPDAGAELDGHEAPPADRHPRG